MKYSIRNLLIKRLNLCHIENFSIVLKYKQMQIDASKNIEIKPLIINRGDLMQNRLDMLRHLSFIGDDNLDIFESYIPSHYDEIYTLYTILKESKIQYNDIQFDNPIENDASFIFICDLKGNNFDKLNKYIEKNDSIICCMRVKTFNIELIESDDNRSRIIFNNI